MKRSTATASNTAAALFAFTFALPVASAVAQTAPGTRAAPPSAPAAPHATAPADSARTGHRDSATDQRQNIVDASQLERGANSFTEGQARSRMQDAGFTNVQNLHKDDNGFWRGRATHNGSTTDVAIDFQGRIAAGPGVTALPTNNANAGSGRNTSTSSSNRQPDGTPGNPPSTVTGRAADRMQGRTPQPDGTPGNPPGTAAGRALDRATGSNTTGANPPAGSGGPAR